MIFFTSVTENRIKFWPYWYLYVMDANGSYHIFCFQYISLSMLLLVDGDMFVCRIIRRVSINYLCCTNEHLLCSHPITFFGSVHAFLIYLIYLCFKATICFSKAPFRVPIFLIFFIPQTVQPPCRSTSVFSGLVLLFSFKAKSFPLCYTSPLCVPAGHTISFFFQRFWILHSSSFLLTHLFMYACYLSPLHVCTGLVCLSYFLSHLFFSLSLHL